MCAPREMRRIRPGLLLMATASAMAVGDEVGGGECDMADSGREKGALGKAKGYRTGWRLSGVVWAEFVSTSEGAEVGELREEGLLVKEEEGIESGRV